MIVTLFQQDFIQNAFLVGTLAAILGAIIGYFVVLRAQAFAGEALTDIGFAGAAGAAVLGINALVGMLGMTFLAALGMGAMGERVRGRDVEIGMIFSFALGLGVLFLRLFAQNSAGQSSSGISILFGSIITLTRQDVLLTFVCGGLILLMLALIFRPLLFASIDPVVATTRGIPVRTLSILFLLLLSATVAVSVQVVGVLLITALLIAPAATALNLTSTPRASLMLAIVLGVGITWLGLLLALIGPGRQLPAGFYIATLTSLAYFASLALRQRLQPRRIPEPECVNCQHKKEIQG